MLFKGMDSSKWQIKVGSCNMLLFLGQRITTKLAHSFPAVVLNLISCITDTKREVVQCALKVFNDLSVLIVTNPDIGPILKPLISAYSRPVEETAGMLDKLLETTFVATVDSPTLGLLVPILRRGLTERNFMYKRKAALIIGNMCKLVRNPSDAAQFYPILAPALTKTREEMSFEEITKVCDETIATLKSVMAHANVNTTTEDRMSREEVETLLLKVIQSEVKIAIQPFKALTDHVASLCSSLINFTLVDRNDWKQCIVPYLKLPLSEASSTKVCKKVTDTCLTRMGLVEEKEDDAEDICKNEFSLAYGGKILLQNTVLHLKRGRRYGLIGQNGVGKTTLMVNIASRHVEGLPENLKTVYVQHDIQGPQLDHDIKNFIVGTPGLENCPEDELDKVLTSVGFDDEKRKGLVNALSGGWKMRLALARAMLMHSDLLLLDEPTNHLDTTAVAWLTDYLRSLTTVTCLIVSHSTVFLDNVCSDIIHHNNLKLTNHRGNLSTFVKFRPEAKSYYELKSVGFEMVFPPPGKLEGVKSRSKVILRMTDCTYTYPGASQPSLRDVSCKATLSSRVAILGVNGAGKSTLIRMLVGDSLPDAGSGAVWKHHNLRIAYVAQHSFHHIEQHLQDSPVKYMQWRFHGGMDREILEKSSMALGPEAQALMGDQPGLITGLGNRRTRNKILEYQVKLFGQRERDNKYFSKSKLEEMGLGNLVKQVDERIAAETAGLDLRSLTTKEIQAHLDEFGLKEEFGTWGKIAGLSGGQKVRLVLAAAMWNQPHLLVLDEPTNYLDREALGAFATAITNFGGGVIMISHDKEFYSALTKEVWTIAGGVLLKEGEVNEEEDIALMGTKKKVVEEEDSAETVVDSAGANTNAVIISETELVDFWGKPLNKKQIRALQKAKAKALPAPAPEADA